MNLELPKVDGLQVLEEIKGRQALRPTRVAVRSYKLDMNAYVGKPVAFKELLHAIQD